MKTKLNQPLLISITPGAVIKTIAIFLMLYVLFVIRDLILVILTSIVIASAIDPAARFFAKRKIPRVISVLLVYVIVALLLVVTFAVFLPPLVNDFVYLSSTFPDYLEVLSQKQFGDIPGLGSLFSTLDNQLLTKDIFNGISSTFSGATTSLIATVSTIFGGVLSFLLIIIISFYLAVQENGVENFIGIVTPVKNEKYVLDLWARSKRKIGFWAQGQVLLAVIIAIMTYLGLSILGVSNPMFLAIIAGMFELIPIFGPILAAIPAVAFALIDGGVSLALLTGGLYAIIQQFESQLIHPLVVKKMVGIPALVAIISLIVGFQLAGFLGVLISVPVAAGIMEYLGDVDRKKKKKKEMKELEELESAK